jgi:hypothetical protein
MPLRDRNSQAGSASLQQVKVFWFFSSEKNKTFIFSKKKKQKNFCMADPPKRQSWEREPPTDKSLFASFSSEKEDSS